MDCKHDLTEREVVCYTDGLCPLCLREENARLRAALKQCAELFSDIRGDWTDPRAQCREGWRAIDAALAPEVKP